jgi:hypothetical protein
MTLISPARAVTLVSGRPARTLKSVSVGNLSPPWLKSRAGAHPIRPPIRPWL